MEVMIPSLGLDFDFSSERSSPHVSPPSTPKRFGNYYFSTPTSPSHLSQFYKDSGDFDSCGSGGMASSVPFGWEEKPGTPKSPPNNGDDFAFDVGPDLDTASLSADELFDAGMIKPLKPPPRLQLPQEARIGENAAVSPSRLSQTKRIIQGAFSPRHKNLKEADPFAVASQNAARSAAAPQRGREGSVNQSKPPSSRTARSLSPHRDSQYSSGIEEQEEREQQQSVCSAVSASMKSHKKWRLKDLFLFRSASEGRAADKDPLKKHTAAIRHSSFRAIDSPGAGSGSRRRGPLSAHELPYTVNRAVSEDLKKKTFLPYRQGILGRLAFNPAVHALANGFGFSRK